MGKICRWENKMVRFGKASKQSGHTVAVSQMVNVELQQDPAIPLLDAYIPKRNENTCPCKTMYAHVHSEESNLFHFVRFREKSLWKSPDLTPPPANQSEPLASPGRVKPRKGEPIRTQHLTLHQKVTNQTRRLPFFEFFA